MKDLKKSDHTWTEIRISAQTISSIIVYQETPSLAKKPQVIKECRKNCAKKLSHQDHCGILQSNFFQRIRNKQKKDSQISENKVPKRLQEEITMRRIDIENVSQSSYEVTICPVPTPCDVDFRKKTIVH